eukprot:226191-Alexandrium_andersonii.AAC.1
MKGRNQIDLRRHGDEGMATPERWGRLAYLFDRRIQQVAYLTVASSTPPPHARGHAGAQDVDGLAGRHGCA